MGTVVNHPGSVGGMSAGGGFAAGPNTYSNIVEDFTLITAAPINGTVVSPSGITAFLSGAAAATALQASTATERGLLQYQTGTATTGQTGFLVGGGNNKSFLIQQSDAVYIATKKRITTLSDGTNTFTSFMGFSDSSTAIGTNAVVIQYDISIDATHWVFTSKVAGTPANIISNVTVTAGAYNLLEFIKLAGSTTWTGYIDGTAVGTATGIPAVAMCGVDYILKSAGTTSRSQDVDWILWQTVQATKRNPAFLA